MKVWFGVYSSCGRGVDGKNLGYFWNKVRRVLWVNKRKREEWVKGKLFGFLFRFLDRWYRFWVIYRIFKRKSLGGS